jgi:hypothetical protein
MKKGQSSILSFFGQPKPKNTVAPAVSSAAATSTPPAASSAAATPEVQKPQKKSVRFSMDLEDKQDTQVKENVEPTCSDMDIDPDQSSTKVFIYKYMH